MRGRQFFPDPNILSKNRENQSFAGQNRARPSAITQPMMAPELLRTQIAVGKLTARHVLPLVQQAENYR
jgi:hypothetical protein